METEKVFIILVDDNPVNLHTGYNALSDKYCVATARSAEMLFRFLKKNIPAMILLDIDMPEMSGYEAIKILKSQAQTKDIPVIFLSARTGLNDRLESLSMGAVDYIVKPYAPSFLLNRIDAFLVNKQ
ncbi:MAG: response regulator [Treponema sp.]|jgi:DNA-binding response OmpR family regulator|nr:response regulator [Treponema sp.]